MRRYCPVETYTDNYVEYSEVWSRQDIRRFGDTSVTLIEQMQEKVIDVNIKLTDGTTMFAASQITEENLDKMRWEVFRWFMAQPQLVVKEILDLGEAARHQSQLIVEESPVTVESTNQQLMPIS